MKTQEIVKVVIDENDIKTLIKNSLIQQGLNPNKEIHINISRKSEGYGMGEFDVYFIDDTIIECTKIK
jgi:hypothetical protein